MHVPHYNDEGGADSVGSSLLRPKKMFNDKIIFGNNPIGTIDTEPMR